MTASQGWLLRHLRCSSRVEHLYEGQSVRGSNPLIAASSTVIHELTWYVSSTGSTVVLRDIASNRISKWRSVKKNDKIWQ